MWSAEMQNSELKTNWKYTKRGYNGHLMLFDWKQSTIFIQSKFLLENKIKDFLENI